MRFTLGVLALVLSMNAAALAQATSTAPFTLSATPPQTSEICRGIYVFILKANGPPGNGLLYTLDAGSPGSNTRAVWFFADGGNVTHHVTDRVGDGGVGALFVALRDPAQPAVVSLRVTVNGQTYASPFNVPAAQSQTACRNPAFNGAPRI